MNTILSSQMVPKKPVDWIQTLVYYFQLLTWVWTKPILKGYNVYLNAAICPGESEIDNDST